MDGDDGGTDTIRAFATINEPVIHSNTATKTWVDNPPPDRGCRRGHRRGRPRGRQRQPRRHGHNEPASDTLTTTWSFAPVSGVDTGAVCSSATLNAVDTSVTCTDDGTYELTLTADDGANTPVTDSLVLTVGNAMPIVTITAPLDGATTGANVSVSASFTDAGANDTHTCMIDWGDTASTSGTISAGVCSGSHTYTTSGPRVITVTVTDDDGGVGSDTVSIDVQTTAPDCVPSNPPNTLEIRTAPGNLRLDGLPATGQPTFQSNTCLFGFAERKDVTLDRNLNPIAPRATNMAVANPPTRLIPAGTVVDSYLIHGDSLGPSGTGSATLSGSWTFDEPILGVFMGRDNLVITDALVGLTGTPGLTYEQTLVQRGLELGSNDVVRVTGPNTIEVTFDFNAMDEIRVLTGVIAPDCVPSNPPNTLEIRTAPGNLRLDGLPATGQPTFQSNTCLFGFAERKDVTLDRNLNPIAPRATNMAVANPPTRLIPAGTVVDSYLIHGDSLGPSGTGTATLSGSWTFDEPILGVFMGRDNLVITDALVGLTGTPGLTYEQTLVQRGLELGSNDVVRVTGPNTIEVTFDFNAMDEIRVLTGVIAPPTGSITIVKDAAPNDPQDFAFAGLGGFTLDDDTDPTLSNTFTASGLASGTYDVTETVPADWSLSGIECNDGDGGTTVEGATVHVDLDPGQNITCTFTNSRDATVTIVKDAVPNAAQDFGFTGSFGPFSLDDDADPTLSDRRTFTVSGTGFGAKTISETPVAGWSLTGLVCSEGTVSGATASLTVDPGDVINCTFTNTKDATVTIVKDAVPNHAQDFAFTGSFGPFSLDDDADPTLPDRRTFTTSGTAFGTKTVTETAVAGWTLTVVCSEGTVAGDTATLTVDPGDVITCTFTNTQDATITIIKDAQPNHAQDFGFTAASARSISTTTPIRRCLTGARSPCRARPWGPRR